MSSDDQPEQRGISRDSSASALPAGRYGCPVGAQLGTGHSQGKSSKSLDWMKSFSRSLAPWEAGLSRAGVKRWGRGSENPPGTLGPDSLGPVWGVGMEDVGFRLIMKIVSSTVCRAAASGGRRLWEVLSDPGPGVASCRFLVLTLGAPRYLPRHVGILEAGVCGKMNTPACRRLGVGGRLLGQEEVARYAKLWLCDLQELHLPRGGLPGCATDVCSLEGRSRCVIQLAT